MMPFKQYVSKIFFVCILSVSILKVVSADNISLEEDITDDGYLNTYTKIEAAFILSGLSDSDSLQKYLRWYDDLIAKIKTFDFDISNRVESAQTVFLYLHTTWLKTYALESTTLVDIARKKEFNCVAATILFNIICEDLGWECEAFETPTHVYTVFINFNQRVLVENTSSLGFDIMKNLKDYSKYLARYYPENMALRIGLDRLYYYENSKGRTINNTELLGLLAYNRAYLAKDKKDYKTVYKLVLLAQLFNSDSRSNVNFEIGLYYAWGRQLVDQQKFKDAFGVFADGYYRYPDNEDFKQNTMASFFNSMQVFWKDKNWKDTAQLMEEIIVLKLLTDKDRKNLQQLFLSWQNYFKIIADEDSAVETADYLQKLSGN
ncbi:MAG: hypothetical protein JXR46_16765 [Calditrichaceae bacterium]|nr:hypothetical protein [Calditrichaceae bacterium]MBN2710700.1 hypothetical protein [Calditrichaceae bacterium]RQV92729.1 MAG: hypothetical protein EH224_14450 [Calditrichota bacterium]